jgi:hypothetical protein
MSKWSSLIGGKSAPKVTLEAGAVNYSMYAFPALVILIVVLVLIFRKDSTTSPAVGLQKPRLSAKPVVAQPAEPAEPAEPEKTEPAAEPVVTPDSVKADDKADAAAPVEEATVEAKFHVVGSKYWNFDEQEDEPFLENDGNTFSDFQRAFNTGREIVTEENSMTTFRNENHDTFLHEVKRTFTPRNSLSLTDSRTIAVEAYQTVPADLSRENANVILREILSARNEAASEGLDLGDAPSEQIADLEYWSLSSGPEAHLAKSILSRL